MTNRIVIAAVLLFWAFWPQIKALLLLLACLACGFAAGYVLAEVMSK